MDKKIGIVTFRFFNFGTILQSLGLQEALRKVGFENVEILDFPEEPGPTGKAAFIETMKEQVREYGFIIGTIRSLKEVVFALRTRWDMRREHKMERARRRYFFLQFQNRYLHLSKPMTCSELRNSKFTNSLPYDGYIAGSDQIWNDKYTRSLDIFFLKTMPKDKLRMSYAGSFGRTFLEESKIPMFSELISSIDPILVRELGAKRIADRISGRESYVVPDPTLLHDRDFWLNYEEKPEQVGMDDYILVYSLNHDLSIYKEALRIAKKKNKKVIAIKRYFNPPYYHNITWIYAIGPQHFLWLVNHSSMVITNSFHAEVFSLVFNRPCYPFLDKAEEVNERLTSLLSIVGHDHVVTYIGDGHIDPDRIEYDFSRINSSLKTYRKEAYEQHLSTIFSRLTNGESR